MDSLSVCVKGAEMWPHEELQNPAKWVKWLLYVSDLQNRVRITHTQAKLLFLVL